MIEDKHEEFAGQKCDVVILVRDDGSACFSFHSEQGYGHPFLELEEMEWLITRAKNLIAVIKA